MANIAADRVQDSTTTTGTGNLTLAGAPPSGYTSFGSVCANNDTFYYVVEGGAEWEVGFGTYVSATPAIARTAVIRSSNSNNAVSFSAGTKTCAIVNPAVMATWGSLTVTPSSNQNDYAPTGLVYANRLRMNIGATMKLTGLAGGYDGRQIRIKNVSTDYLLWLENENTASSAANRFKLPQGFPLFLMPGDWVDIEYDGTTSRWELTNQSFSGPMGLATFHDFLTQGAAANNGTVGPFGVILSGTGASVQASTYSINTTERPMGVVQYDTGTTATGRVTIGANDAGGIVPTLGPALSVARVARETANSGTETWTFLVGFHDASGGTWNDGVAWEGRWTGAAEEWSQTRMAAAAATRTNTGSPAVDGTYIWLVVFINPDWTRADFIYSTDSVSFSVASSPTTGFPSNTRLTSWGITTIKSAGTTARNFDIDLAGYRVDYVRG